jgi:fatty-acyl-CoA synthase
VIELDWLKRWAMYSPQAVALQCADSNRAFTYRELYERSVTLAKALREEYRIAAGDRVAILALNEPETIFLFFALQRIGAILVPVNFRLSAREVDYVVGDCAPKLFIYQEAYADVAGKLTSKPEASIPFSGLEKMIFGASVPFKAEEEVSEASFEAPVMILYTSGTTGAPKGALITNKMLFWNSVNTGLRLCITPKDAAIIFHPMFHTSGWNVLTTPFFHHGGRIILLKKFDPARVLELAASEKVTLLFGVPTMMDMMYRSPVFPSIELPYVRYAIVGGEPMPIELIRVWGEKGVPVRQGFGLTEFGPNVFSLNEEDAIRKMGSIGFPNFYIDVKIVDENGSELKGANQVGELLLRGPVMTAGYWKNEKATRDAIRDGWFCTGDLVRRDEDGYFYVAGRKKDMFISGGENVYPAEIEQFFRTHSRVHEVAVIGVPDEKWGEVGRAFYSTVDGAPLSDSELVTHFGGNLAKYKVPKGFVHLKALPKGESGKILKKALIDGGQYA